MAAEGEEDRAVVEAAASMGVAAVSAREAEVSAEAVSEVARRHPRPLAIRGAIPAHRLRDMQGLAGIPLVLSVTPDAGQSPEESVAASALQDFHPHRAL